MVKLMAGRTRSRRSQELCLWLCVLHCVLSPGPLGANGAKLRCGSELIEALEFVCGDRGIYLGRRGHGPRSRGRGIVDQCCLGPGCDLHHLERYCAKAKGPSRTTRGPTTEQQVQALLQRLRAPGSPQREAPGREAPQHRPLSSHRRRTKARGSALRSPHWPRDKTDRAV